MHVPKTGGTSIQAALASCGVARLPYRDHAGQLLPRPTDHLTLQEREELHASVGDDDILCTIRDPEERFASGARFFGMTPIDFMVKCKHAVPSEVFRDQHPGTEFYQHCRPQTDYTHPDTENATNATICTYILPMEDIDREAPELLHRYGCNVDSISRLNVSRNKKKPLPETVRDFVHDFYARDYALLPLPVTKDS